MANIFSLETSVEAPEVNVARFGFNIATKNFLTSSICRGDRMDGTGGFLTSGTGDEVIFYLRYLTNQTIFLGVHVGDLGAENVP